jgi:hypothetical protein
VKEMMSGMTQAGWRFTHSWYDLGFALFSPFGYLGVNLLSQLWLDLSGVP